MIMGFIEHYSEVSFTGRCQREGIAPDEPMVSLVDLFLMDLWKEIYYNRELGQNDVPISNIYPKKLCRQ